MFFVVQKQDRRDRFKSFFWRVSRANAPYAPPWTPPLALVAFLKISKLQSIPILRVIIIYPHFAHFLNLFISLLSSE